MSKITLYCVECGAEAEAACECGVAYEPPSERAEKVAAEHPELSVRATAKKAGVGRGTAARAKARVPMGHLKSLGRDGKSYPARSRRLSPIRPAPLTEDKREIIKLQEEVDRLRGLVLDPKASPQQIAEAIFKVMPDKADRIATALFALVTKAKMAAPVAKAAPPSDLPGIPADLSIPSTLLRSKEGTL